ncbi:DNA methylase N-4/N-6 domain-containing protein, partial [Burkholderia cepacia]|nr:DNA methylase N-4/N-6 domain-containing protein [Burkholderia cepacia]
MTGTQHRRSATSCRSIPFRRHSTAVDLSTRSPRSPAVSWRTDRCAVRDECRTAPRSSKGRSRQ